MNANELLEIYPIKKVVFVNVSESDMLDMMYDEETSVLVEVFDEYSFRIDVGKAHLFRWKFPMISKEFINYCRVNKVDYLIFTTGF